MTLCTLRNPTLPVRRQRLHDDLLADERPGVLRHENLGLVAPHEVDGLGPELRVPRGGAADGVEIREGAVDVVAGEEDLPLRPPDVDLVVGLARRVDELEGDVAALGDGQPVGEHVGRPLVLGLVCVRIEPARESKIFNYGLWVYL